MALHTANTLECLKFLSGGQVQALDEGDGIGDVENVQGAHVENRHFVGDAIAVRILLLPHHLHGLNPEMKLHGRAIEIAHREFLFPATEGPDHQNFFGRPPGIVLEADPST